MTMALLRMGCMAADDLLVTTHNLTAAIITGTTNNEGYNGPPDPVNGNVNPANIPNQNPGLTITSWRTNNGTGNGYGTRFRVHVPIARADHFAWFECVETGVRLYFKDAVFFPSPYGIWEWPLYTDFGIRSPNTYTMKLAAKVFER